jgi:ribonuclease HI
VLSPLLWCLLVNDIIKTIHNKGIYTQGYADDIAIIVRGKYPDTLSDIMQTACNDVERWCEEQNLSVNPKKTNFIIFTRKRKLEGLRNPILFGERLELVDQVKYLGVILDTKLTWNNHLDYVIKKAKTALCCCRRAMGQTWGLSPKVSMWMYRAIVRPIVTYASIIWWTKTQQVTAQTKLRQLQRQACLAVTGAMSTTPTRSLEVILNLPPLHLFIEKEARAQALKWSTHWPVGLDRARSNTPNVFQVMPNASAYIARPDGIPVTYDFQKPFKVVVPDRDLWESGQALPSKGILIYTDGSKTSFGTGAGAYCQRPGLKLKFNLGRLATVFQAEIFAIQGAADECLRRNINNDTLYLLSDSRAALGALNSPEVRSQLVLSCLKSLRNLGKRNTLTLMWVPGHRDIQGNEAADRLAKKATEKQFTGPEPYLGLHAGNLKMALEIWLLRAHTSEWNQVGGLRQSRLFLGGPQGKSRNMLCLSRTKLRMLVGALTGHCWLRKHLHTMGVYTDDLECRACCEEDETTEHVLCECHALARTRLDMLGKAYPSPDEYRTFAIPDILRFLEKSDLFGMN